MRIPAINFDFNPIMSRYRSKRPVLTVRLNMTQTPDFKAVICHAIVKKASFDRAT